MLLDPIEARQSALPPVFPLSLTTLVLVVAGGIIMAAQIGRRSSLTVPTTLAVVAAAALVVNVVLLSRVREFAWAKFRLVAGWALLAYVFEAGMLEYVFVHDHVPGSQLALFTAMLAMFAVDIPLLLGFSVARYQPTSSDMSSPI